MARYSDFAKAWATQDRSTGFDESGQGQIFPKWGEDDPTAELRRRFGIPGNVSDAQIQSYYEQNDLPAPHDSGGFGRQLADFASVPLWMGSMALGGPVIGAISAANGSGATQSLGVDPRLTTAAALAYGASNGGTTGAETAPSADGGAFDMGHGMGGVYDYQSPMNGSFWNNTYAANNTGTMTDAGPNPPDGGNMYLDDYGNPMDFTPSSGPGYSEADWTPTSGWSTNPSVADLGGNVGGAGLSDLFDQAQQYAKKYGGTALQALAILARGAPGVAGAIGANRQAGALSALSDRYTTMGAPSRARYEESFAPGFTMANDPGYKDALDQTTKATLHGMSVNGNPAGSPNAWTQTLSDVNSKFAYPALQAYRTGNANAGGLATFNAAAPGAAAGAIDARGNVMNAAGAAVNDIFNPRKSLADLLREARVA